MWHKTLLREKHKKVLNYFFFTTLLLTSLLDVCVGIKSGIRFFIHFHIIIRELGINYVGHFIPLVVITEIFYIYLNSYCSLQICWRFPILLLILTNLGNNYIYKITWISTWTFTYQRNQLIMIRWNRIQKRGIMWIKPSSPICIEKTTYYMELTFFVHLLLLTTRFIIKHNSFWHQFHKTFGNQTNKQMQKGNF